MTLAPYQTATVRFRAGRPAAAISLAVRRDAALGFIHLEWQGGRAPFTLRRALDPAFTQDVVTLLEGSATSYDDPVLNDGVTYFYDVTGGP